ncbi:MarR family transcriptional regulator [Roseibium hamelinense]|nr:MarR family winged helix-turn-helix transcriptional regulator [Roseibium hamelinense]MTI45192.1 MarR family transcriptional regulator [Roseibium hamelinense]
MAAEDDFSLCMMNNARKAARAVSRRYDRLAKPFGIKAAQFAILGLIKRHSGETMTQLAILAGMDRTTLLRNLTLLEKKGLVAPKRFEKGAGRTYELTAMGDLVIQEMTPHWRQAQQDLEAEMGPENFAHTLAVLKRLSSV